MKTIIINGRFLLHRVTGVQRYARELLSELDKLINPGEFILAIPSETVDVPNFQNIKVERIGNLHNRLWEHISFPRYVRKMQGISLNLCNVAPLSDPGIVCIHDVKIKAYPQYFSKSFILWYKLLFNNAIKHAKVILTVSEFSKNEILKYYSCDKDRIVVVPDAWQHFNRIPYDENALGKYGLSKDNYFFSMCSLEPNKNFKWIAEAARKNPSYTFAVSGSINKSVFANGLGFECPDNMKLLGYVSDEEAKTLMRDCKAFLFPTIYEGFGIPPLEALSAGAGSVVVSDSEVMHEIFDNSVSFIDPYDYDYCFSDERDVNAIEDSERCSILSKYSWEKSARKLYQLINSF